MKRVLRSALPAVLALVVCFCVVLSDRLTASIPAPATGNLRARKIVERAMAAHGGLQAWLSKKDASFSTTWTHYAGGQPSFSSRYIVKFPTAPGPAPAVVEGDENGKPVLMGMSGSRSWFVVGGERFDDLESLKANRAFVRKAYGLLALPFRLDDSSTDVTYDGDEVRGGAVVDRIKVSNGLDPAALYLFDRETGRLAGMGSEVATPPTAIVSDYAEFTFVDGILVPRRQVFDRVDLRTGGRSRILTVSVDGVRFDNGFPRATFEPPAIP
ncbi:MAG TPA: hypothetical protein VFE84_04125 [Patescibacteria group bacterium]|jgi:hypothetical protein|nr:hypothetical protein [Patescibacteria group bacterium]